MSLRAFWVFGFLTVAAGGYVGYSASQWGMTEWDLLTLCNTVGTVRQ